MEVRCTLPTLSHRRGDRADFESHVVLVPTAYLQVHDRWGKLAA